MGPPKKNLNFYLGHFKSLYRIKAKLFRFQIFVPPLLGMSSRKKGYVPHIAVIILFQMQFQFPFFQLNFFTPLRKDNSVLSLILSSPKIDITGWKH